MDCAETLAKCLLEDVIEGARMEFRADQSHGVHDFDLRYQDGRIAAVEVTAAVDKSANEMETAIKKGGRFVYTPGPGAFG